MTTSTYYVTVNGGLAGYFLSSQGDETKGSIVQLFVFASNGVPNSGAKKRILGCKEGIQIPSQM